MQKKELTCARRRTSIGGQALMEGIMMRGPKKNAMAVRRPNGKIFFEESENEKKKRPAICRWPVIRGVFGFVDSLVIGYKALMRSAEISCEEVPEQKKTEQGEAVAQPPVPDAVCAQGEPREQAPVAAPEEKPEETAVKKSEDTADDGEEAQSVFGKGAMAAIMIIATVLGFALAIGLFIWLPSFLYSVIAGLTPDAWDLGGNRYLRSVFEGVLKILILVAYMALVSLMKDIRRTFMYHGAEHKTIFCYENGLPLTVENVRKQGRFHPRCGTSFLILMLMVSIAIGLFIPPSIDGIPEAAYTAIRAGIKLLLIPLTMGVGYEILKFAGRHDNWLTRVISAPGKWLQRITVLEPTDDMIECAIKAFIAVLPEEEIEKERAAITAEAEKE